MRHGPPAGTLSSIILVSSQGPEGKCQDDVPNAFRFFGNASPQVFVGDKIQKPFFQFVRTEHRPLLRIGRRNQTADIAVARASQYPTGRRSDQTIGCSIQSSEALDA